MLILQLQMSGLGVQAWAREPREQSQACLELRPAHEHSATLCIVPVPPLIGMGVRLVKFTFLAPHPPSPTASARENVLAFLADDGDILWPSRIHVTKRLFY